MDPTEEPVPSPAGTSVVQQEMRAVFVGWIGSAAGPMVVGNYIAQGDAVGIHQIGGQFGSAFDRGGDVIAAVLAHFYADRIEIARPIKVGVPRLLVGRHVLDGEIPLNGKVPGRAELATLEGFGVGKGIARTVLS